MVDNNVKITIDCSDDFIVSMHRGELQTVLINIVDNAIYWTSQKNKKEDGKGVN